MTLAMVLLVFAFTIFGSMATTAAAVTGHIVEIIPDELEPSTRVGNTQISDLTGAPLALYRVNYPVTAGTAEAMARQYLRENTVVLHLQSADLSHLKHSFTHTGPAGTTVRFNQVINGIPVYKAVIVVHINNNNIVTYVASDYKSNINLDNYAPTVTKNNAHNAAENYLDVQGNIRYDKTQLIIYQVQDQSYLAYLVRLIADSPLGDWEVIVDAHTGEFLKVFDTSYRSAHQGNHEPAALMAAQSPPLLNRVPVTGTGTVFDPDPLSSALATYGDTGFVDGSDADTTQLNGELITVDLLEIDFSGGMYTLIGPYAEIVDSESPFNGLFAQATDTFNFNRFDDAFEAVNTYYHIDSSMRYINETLGIPITPIQYSGGARFDPHGLSGADNSHYLSGTGEVAFGEGGVDDAEDSDVIHHELGHALHDWVTNGSLSQVNGLSEGLGDYWAQSYNRSLGNWLPADPPFQWVFNWDGHNPFWPGRITNYGAVYPGGLVGQVHTDGQIWSTCNMKVYEAIGRTKIDTAMWEGLAMTNSSTNQEMAANAVYQAAIDLGYPAADLQAIHDIYATCVYVVPPVPTADFDVIGTPGSLAVCAPNDAVYSVNVTEFQDFSDTVVLSSLGQPNPPNSVLFSVNNQPPPYTSTLTVGTTGATAGSYAISIVGMSPTTTHTATVQLNVATTVPGTTTLVAPASGSSVSTTPTFEWTAVGDASSYYLEVATDIGFSTLVYTATVAAPDTTHTANTALSTDTLYYWRVTAVNGCGSGTASTPFTFRTGAVYCSTPSLAIPDNDPNGITNDLVIASSESLTDLDISLDVTHTYVGDLIFTIEHVDTGTTATFIDRPGYTGVGFGCSGDNIDVIANDEGVDGDIESQCSNLPAINGDRVGGDPPNSSLLAAFDGESIAGTWRITASDNVAQDSGTLNEWCLLLPAIPKPIIEVKPATLSSSQSPNTQVVETLTISNTGDADLDWDIFEDGTTSADYSDISLVSPVATCDAPDDISWITVNPISGTVPTLSADLVNVTFDSTGLSTGTYSGTLCINSNDPVNPIVQVPLTMTVNTNADIMITSPLSGTILTALNGTDIDATIEVTITNDFMIPADGHWHLWLNGTDTGPVLDYTATVNLSLGTHVITAQLDAPDHTPLGSTDTITVTVVADSSPHLLLPFIVREN